MMKRILLYILILTCNFYVSHAQDGPEVAGKKERIKALYVAYVTKELNLTEAEAQKFWPLHAQFDAEIRAVGVDMAELQRQQKILDIKVKYQDRFTNILGSTRSNTFFRVDNEFRRKLIDEMRKRRQQHNMNPTQPGKRQNP
jgi:hypothetical protein